MRVHQTPQTVLYQGKLLLRGRKDIRANVISLPYFKATRKSASDAEHRQFVKEHVTQLAAAGMQIGHKIGSALNFVALFLLTVSGDRVELRVRSPHPTRSPLGEDTSRGDLGAVQHKYQLVADTWMPLAFVCDPAAYSALVTNQNHLADPGQFLEVERCKSTSGFLNFFGALAMLQSVDLAGPYLDRADEWLSTAMHERCDEWLRWMFSCINAADLGLQFDRVLVDVDSPETWFFDTDGNLPEGVSP